MPVTLDYHAALKYLLVQLSGTLTREDYDALVPQVEQLFTEHGKLKLLVELRHFHGWEPSAAWEDIKFAFHHFDDIQKIALVGENGWHEGMAPLCKPFTSASVRYFKATELHEAREWLIADSIEETGEGPGSGEPS